MEAADSADRGARGMYFSEAAREEGEPRRRKRGAAEDFRKAGREPIRGGFALPKRPEDEAKSRAAARKKERCEEDFDWIDKRKTVRIVS